MKDKKRDFSIFRRTEFSLILIILALFLIATFGTANFFTEYNLMNILKQCSINGVIAISATMIIITGGIDLSCGAIVGMSTLMVAMGQARWGLPIAASILIAILVGIVCGLYNAIIINELNVPPFIATLGSMTIIRGLIKVISNAAEAGIHISGRRLLPENTVSGLALDCGCNCRVSDFKIYYLWKEYLCSGKWAGSGEALRHFDPEDSLYDLWVCGVPLRNCRRHAGGQD